MGIFGHILGTALSGGLFGLIGNIAAKLFAYLQSKQQFLERQAQWTYETDLLKLQNQARAPETENATAPDMSWTALTASLRDDALTAISYPWVNAVRSLVRPVLTCGLAAVLAFAFFAMKASDPERGYVIDSLVFAGVGAITWWFGDRAPQAQPMTRDPVIEFDSYFREAQAALDCLWPLGSPESRLIYGVVLRVMDFHMGDAIHQSALDQLSEAFAEAVDEAEDTR